MRILLLSLLLTGCANYEFGDATREVFDARGQYCNAQTEAEREAALLLIRTWLPDYPEDGICEPGFISKVLSEIAQ